jgi:hypothetical protein
MAKTAVSELRQQIEEVRREAFAAGYAAAMHAVRELASRPGPNPGSNAVSRRAGSGQTRSTTMRAKSTAAQQRRAGSKGATTRRRRSAVGRPERGANAQRVQEILKASAPRALRIAEIRKSLQEKGTEISFTSLRHALSQLETRNAAEQVGNSRTWRLRGGAI